MGNASEANRYNIIEIELGVIIALFLGNLFLDIKRYNNTENENNGNNENSGRTEYKE